MTPVSNRFLVPLLAMLWAAMVPVTAHHLIGLQNEDCADPAGLMRVAIDGTRVTGEATDEYTEAVIQYTNGRFGGGAEFRWVRSLNPRHVYKQRPRWTPGLGFRREPVLHRIEVDGVELPIRLWETHSFGQSRIAATLLIYQGRPVEDVFVASVVASIPQLFHGPRAVNFIGVHGLTSGSNPLVVRTAVIDWLAKAWTHYQQVCGTNG